jgi:hypothetical protein
MLLRSEAGASTVELAIAFMAFVTLVIGFMQVSIWALSISITQIGLREGCRAGVAAYHPAPVSGNSGAGLPDPELSQQAYEVAAVQAATGRAEEILQWLPLTHSFDSLTASVVESGISRGVEGTREFRMSVTVSPPLVVPLAEDWLPAGSGGLLEIHRECRMRLARYYTY